MKHVVIRTTEEPTLLTMNLLLGLKVDSSPLPRPFHVAYPAPKILFHLEQFTNYFHYFSFAIIVALNCGYQLPILISGHDTMTRQLRALDIFLAIPFSNLAGGNLNFLAMLFALIIHDDRNFITKHSSIEIVVDQGRFFLLGQSRSHKAQRQKKNEQGYSE